MSASFSGFFSGRSADSKLRALAKKGKKKTSLTGFLCWFLFNPFCWSRPCHWLSSQECACPWDREFGLLCSCGQFSTVLCGAGGSVAWGAGLSGQEAQLVTHQRCDRGTRGFTYSKCSQGSGSEGSADGPDAGAQETWRSLSGKAERQVATWGLGGDTQSAGEEGACRRATSVGSLREAFLRKWNLRQNLKADTEPS